MENIIAISLGAFAVLVIFLYITNRKIQNLKSRVAQAQLEAKKAYQSLELIRGQLQQIKNVNFDLSGIESEVEENTQQLVSYLRQELGSLDEDLKDVVERVEELGELEERVGNLENRLEEIEEKK